MAESAAVVVFMRFDRVMESDYDLDERPLRCIEYVLPCRIARPTFNDLGILNTDSDQNTKLSKIRAAYIEHANQESHITLDDVDTLSYCGWSIDGRNTINTLQAKENMWAQGTGLEHDGVFVLHAHPWTKEALEKLPAQSARKCSCGKRRCSATTLSPISDDDVVMGAVEAC